MGRGKRAKTNFYRSEERQRSSSSSSLGQSMRQNQAGTASGLRSNVNKASVNDLPPELLVEILKCLDFRSLFKCRLVNRQWSEISTGILHQRSNVKIPFSFEDKEFFRRKAKSKNQQGTSLSNFLYCMKKSKNCPFVRFIFIYEGHDLNFDYSDFFGDKDYKAFLSAVGESNKNRNQYQKQNQRIKIKSLEFRFLNMNVCCRSLLQHLRDLLFKIPHLEELGLDFWTYRMADAEMKLFPDTVKNPVVQLGHLKTIHFNQTMTSECPEILKDLLNAAVNLNKIYFYEDCYSFYPQIYDFLHPLGKFRLLKTFEFHVDNKFLLKVKECPDFTDALFKLQLERLRIHMHNYELSDADCNYVTVFISHLFESNKNSLRNLTTNPFGVFNGLQFPTFKNLIYLKIRGRVNPPDIFFFPGVRSRDIFTAVRQLDLSECYWSAAFPQLDSIPIFPRVQNLSLDDRKFTPDSIRVLSLLCPNLKHLKIHRDPNSPPYLPPIANFLDIGRAIWAHLKQLESLEIYVDVDSPENNPSALDSCFTGISEENCQRLSEIIETQKTLEKWGSQARIPESELTAEREHPSILDVTNLKTLKINAYLGGKLRKRKDFFTENLTCVSEEFAFKFMPHLKSKPETSLNDYEEEETWSSPSSSSSDAEAEAEAETETQAESGQGSNVTEPSLNLPPEILMGILKFVDTRSLFNCRAVNLQWNEISSAILCKRSDAKITFTSQDKQFFQRRANSKDLKKTSLNNFLTCMKESKNCLFSRFAFSYDFGYLNFFNQEDWKSFVAAVGESSEKHNQNQNQRIKIKSLELKVTEYKAPFRNFIYDLFRNLIYDLRNLLLNKIPHLEELDLDFSEMIREKYLCITLFHTTAKTTVAEFQLAHLKAIRFHPSMISNFPGVLKDLLSAAVNLEKIYLYESTAKLPFEIYDLLQQLGKFHLLKTFFVGLNDVFSQVEQRPDFTIDLLNLELEELEPDEMFNNHEIGHNFVSILFESNKNSLRKLVMTPLGNLDRLQFPRFKNLTELKLKEPHGPQSRFFPQGIRFMDIFPAIQKLDLPECDWSAAFPHFGYIPIFRRVLNLSVYDRKFTPDSIRVLSLLCPNLKHLKIHRDPNSRPQINFLDVGRSIWTLMMQLESLDIDIDLDSPENNPAALDSCFTGISEESCQRLVELTEAKKMLKKWGFQSNVPDSELTAEREHPSILDMTNLKRLKINPYSGERMLKRKDVVTKKLTWISQEYAFKLLPHLELNGRKCSERIHDLSYCAEN